MNCSEKWVDCFKCSMHEKRNTPIVRKFPSMVAGNMKSKIMFLLSENLSQEDSYDLKTFLERIVEHATEGSMDLRDFAICGALGCQTVTHCKKDTPFKEMYGAVPKAITACRERVFDVINEVDPDILILSGLSAAKAMGIHTKLVAQFQAVELIEVHSKGVLTKVMRPALIMPSLGWLYLNFKENANNVFKIVNKAVKYHKLKSQLIGHTHE